MSKPKIIVIGGPTASGKSQLAIELAKEFNGEIINADSRQFYIGMDIGTGKEKIERINKDNSVLIQQVKHHLIDILKPNEKFNLFEFQKIAFETIDKILKQNKIPILVGGTGLYLDSIVYNYQLSEKETDPERRSKLIKLDVNELQSLLKTKDTDTFDSLTESDKKNPHRLIRAIERIESGTNEPQKGNPLYDVTYICLSSSKDKLNNRINERVDKMFDNGLIEENKKLKSTGYNIDMNSIKSIGYQEFEEYFKENQTLEETSELIKLHTRQYAKRQITWFKRNKYIKWISNPKDAFKLLSDFLIQS
jgi:tRNA dimethylallyltransferase